MKKSLTNLESSTVFGQNINEFLNSILESISDSFFLLDREYRYIGFNKAHVSNMEKIYGVDIEIGKNQLDYQTVCEDREQARKNYGKALQGERVLTCGYWGNPSILRQYFEISYNPIYNSKEEIIGLTVHCKDITERAKTEQALLDSERKFRQLFENSPIPICSVRNDGSILLRNKQFINLFGYDEMDAPTLVEWWQMGYPNAEYRKWVMENWNAAVKKAVETNSIIEPAVYKVTCKNGIERNIIISGIALPDSAIATFVDITAQRNAEEKFRSIAEQSNDLIAITDVSGIITYASSAAKRLFGIEPEKMCDENFIKFLDEESIPKAMAFFNNLLENKQNAVELVLTMKRNDGSLFLGELNGSVYCAGDQKGSLVVIHDITKQKLAEEETKKIGQYYQTIIEKAPDGIVLLNSEGFIKYISPSAIEILGFDNEKEINANAFELVHPNDKEWVVSNINQVIENPSYVSTLQFRYLDKNKNLKWIGCTLRNSLDDPNVKSIIINFKDVTERRNAEETLQENKVALNNLLVVTSDFINCGSKGIDYQKLSDLILEISGAKYSVFNLVDEDDHYFTPVAVSGQKEVILKAYSQMGFNPENKKWECDTLCKEKIKDNVLTKFYSFHDLIGDVISTDLSESLGETLNIGEIWIVKITKNNKSIGHFTLIISKTESIKNPEIVELYANQIGLFFDREASELTLRRSEEKYRYLFANSPQPMFIHNIDTLCFIEVNDAAVKHYGYSKEEFTSMTLKDIRPPEGIPILINKIELIKRGLKYDKETVHIKKNGGLIFVEITSVSVISNGRNVQLVLVNDITERKLAEKALEEQMNELMRFNNLTIDRELTMIELKREINDLLENAGKKTKYRIVD